jgi:hypothetical protein
MKNWAAFGVFLCVNACAVSAGAQQVAPGSWVLEDNGPPNTVLGVYSSAQECAQGQQDEISNIEANIANLPALAAANNEQLNPETVQMGYLSLQMTKAAICIQQ